MHARTGIGTRRRDRMPACPSHAMRMRTRLLRCALALAVLLSAPAPAQDLAVPRQHQKLYDALEEQVSAFGRALPPLQGDEPLLHGALLRTPLAAAPRENCSALPGPKRNASWMPCGASGRKCW
ncbi:MAG: hypothetical protein KIS79_01245 [Burkholderiales bacterium]|nr:hypothetical protein [Burkholderiales bacterium]